MNNQDIDTVVIGGGQAGLSTSWNLKRLGHQHLVLDRGRVGDTWRNRWDSFCLVTPNWCCRLPGSPYDGQDPNGFMLRDEIVDYVERFAASFDPPFHGGVNVEQVKPATTSGRFRLETSDGVINAENLIITIGTHQHPNIPTWSKNLPDDILQLHSRDYRNPGLLPDGAVLVIGSGQSGCQIVDDLRAAGRETHLCVGNAGRTPRRYRGRDIIEWEVATGSFDLPIEEHPKGLDIRFDPHPHLSGRGGGRTIDLRQLALDGVELHGRLLEVNGTNAVFEHDLEETLANIDRECRENLDDIDRYIAQNEIDAPDDDIEVVDWQPGEHPQELDLRRAGIRTVIYGTGFHFDFSWIDLPVLDQRGYPRYERGVTTVPGLYFVGLHWMHTMGSGLFYGVAGDAKYVVNQLNRNSERDSSSA